MDGNIVETYFKTPGDIEEYADRCRLFLKVFKASEELIASVAISAHEAIRVAHLMRIRQILLSQLGDEPDLNNLPISNPGGPLLTQEYLDKCCIWSPDNGSFSLDSTNVYYD